MPKLSMIALLAAAATLSHAQAQELSPRLDLELGGTTEAANARLGLLVPYAIGPGVIGYGDIRGSLTSEGQLSGSLGLGVRGEVGEGWLLGGYGYLDMGQGLFGTNFTQISAGIEALSDSFEFRINGYLPVGDTEAAVDELSTVSFEDGGFAVRQGYEVALHGVDAEIGVVLPVFEADDNKSLKLLANAYHFDSELSDAHTGVGLRAEFTIGDLGDVLPGAALTLGAGLNYDSQDELSGNAFFRLSAPIGGNELVDRVERRDRIFTDAGDFGAAEVGLIGGSAARVAEISSDTTDLNAVLTDAGVNGIILATGDIDVDDTLILLAGQVLLGGGGTIDVTASGSGKTVTFTNTGARTTLWNGAATPASGFGPMSVDEPVDVIRMAEGSTVQSVSIEGGVNAIVAEGVNDVTIRDVSIAGSLNGVSLSNVDGALIENSTISNIICVEINPDDECTYSQSSDPDYLMSAGINALGVTDLTIRNVTMDNVSHGIFIASEVDEDEWPVAMLDQSSGIVIENVAITETLGEGLMFFGVDGATVRDLSVVNVGDHWDLDMIVLLDSQNIHVDGAILDGGVNGINVVNGIILPRSEDMNSSFTNIAIDNMSRTGIILNWAAGIDFSNITIDNAGIQGIALYGNSYSNAPVADISFSNVSIDTVGTRPSNWEEEAGLLIYGPMANLSGDITYTGTEVTCSADLSPWSGTELVQDPGHVLTINGSVVDEAALAASCE
ncbi:MAG: right-handed parallel beta-helix repeat-containing protein [Devosia sp.]